MTHPTLSAVALLSGGLDSSVAMALALRQGISVSLALTLDYGQRASACEKRQAKRMAAHYKVPHQILALPWFNQFQQGGGLLRPERPLPKPSQKELSERDACVENAKAVWVPNRNGVFIEIAAGI